MVSRAVQTALVSADDTAGVVRVLLVTVACTTVAALVVHLAHLGDPRRQLTAGARALVQLSVVGLVIAAVLASWPWTIAFCVLMTAVAALTAGRRVWSTWTGWALVPLLCGLLPVTALLLASGVVPLKPVSVVPVLGILIGNAMTATTLAGKRLLEAWRERWGEYEAALSIGLPHREAAVTVVRDDAALALVPGLDQTRTVGLVTLPGAFVGVMLGGGSAWQAAAVQLVVLAALLLVQAVTVAVMVELVVRRTTRPA